MFYLNFAQITVGKPKSLWFSQHSPEFTHSWTWKPAPEANAPLLQSPKMDIYSFGVLLVEM